MINDDTLSQLASLYSYHQPAEEMVDLVRQYNELGNRLVASTIIGPQASQEDNHNVAAAALQETRTRLLAGIADGANLTEIMNSFDSMQEKQLAMSVLMNVADIGMADAVMQNEQPITEMSEADIATYLDKPIFSALSLDDMAVSIDADMSAAERLEANPDYDKSQAIYKNIKEGFIAHGAIEKSLEIGEAVSSFVESELAENGDAEALVTLAEQAMAQNHFRLAQDLSTAITRMEGVPDETREKAQNVFHAIRNDPGGAWRLRTDKIKGKIEVLMDSFDGSPESTENAVFEQGVIKHYLSECEELATKHERIEPAGEAYYLEQLGEQALENPRERLNEIRAQTSITADNFQRLRAASSEQRKIDDDSKAEIRRLEQERFSVGERLGKKDITHFAFRDGKFQDTGRRDLKGRASGVEAMLMRFQQAGGAAPYTADNFAKLTQTDWVKNTIKRSETLTQLFSDSQRAIPGNPAAEREQRIMDTAVSRLFETERIPQFERNGASFDQKKRHVKTEKAGQALMGLMTEFARQTQAPNANAEREPYTQENFDRLIAADWVQPLVDKLSEAQQADFNELKGKVGENFEAIALHQQEDQSLDGPDNDAPPMSATAESESHDVMPAVSDTLASDEPKMPGPSRSTSSDAIEIADSSMEASDSAPAAVEKHKAARVQRGQVAPAPSDASLSDSSAPQAPASTRPQSVQRADGQTGEAVSMAGDHTTTPKVSASEQMKAVMDKLAGAQPSLADIVAKHKRTKDAMLQKFRGKHKWQNEQPNVETDIKAEVNKMLLLAQSLDQQAAPKPEDIQRLQDFAGKPPNFIGLSAVVDLESDTFSSVAMLSHAADELSKGNHLSESFRANIEARINPVQKAQVPGSEVAEPPQEQAEQAARPGH